MCFKNLPIEFDAQGKPYLRAGVANPYAPTTTVPRGASAKFLGKQPVRAGYCVDCLSQLYGEPVEAIDAYLTKFGITGHQAHCGNCGEHKDAFLVLLPRRLMR